MSDVPKWKLERCRKMLEGAALAKTLAAESRTRANQFRRDGSYNLAFAECPRIEKLEQLHGILVEIASEQLLAC